MKYIYADNAATTKMSPRALEVISTLSRDVFGNPSSLYGLGQKAREVLDNARYDIAECIGASPKEIYFTSGGSEADNQAIRSAAYAGARKGKKHIVSTAFEHHAVLHTLDALKKEGFEITLLDVHENGVITPEDLMAALREDTALVTVMYANNEIGTVQPIAQLGQICRERGIPFHTDAVQAIPHIKIDVKQENIDYLSMSAHKFHGPKGIGVLYVRSGMPLQNLIYGGAQERGKRAGTENVPAAAAMAAALKETCENLEENAEHAKMLSDMLIEGLQKIPHSILNGDREKRLPGTVNFCFEGIEGESLLLLLDDSGICASSGSACTSGSLDPSHVLLSLGRPHEVAHGSLRLSVNHENTKEEIEKIIDVVERTVSYLRSISPVWEDLESGKRQHII